jgi:hypothetical protein
MGLFDTTWSIQVEKLLPPVLRDADFSVVDDDFEQHEADNHFIERIVCSAPGHWKEFPPVGVGIFGYIQGTESPQVLKRNIMVQLQNDIFKKPLVEVRDFPTVVINNITLTLGEE